MAPMKAQSDYQRDRISQKNDNIRLKEAKEKAAGLKSLEKFSSAGSMIKLNLILQTISRVIGIFEPLQIPLQFLVTKINEGTIESTMKVVVKAINLMNSPTASTSIKSLSSFLSAILDFVTRILTQDWGEFSGAWGGAFGGGGGGF